MAIKEASFRQPASPDYRGSENPPSNRPEENVSEKVAESNPEDSKPADSEASSLTTVIESLSKVIEQLSAEKKPEPSKFKRFLIHPFLTSSLFVVFFTGLVGGALTYYYTSLQKEVDHQRSIQQLQLASERSFSDELNKIRIQKIGEVWEQIDKNEVMIDSLWEKAYEASDSNNQNVEAINALIQEDKVIASKYSFWLGKELYNKIQDYLEKNVRLALNMMLAPQGTDLSKLLEERKNAKQDILKVKESMLSEGKPGK